MPTPIPQTKLLGIAAIVSLLLATGAFVIAWTTQDLGYADGTAAGRAAGDANRVANAYAIVGFVMIATTVFTLVLRHLAKRRLVTRPS
jgi:mannose/fructose/N-acetylgalactosamine-specific phosphotransferase system component IID